MLHLDETDPHEFHETVQLMDMSIYHGDVRRYVFADSDHGRVINVVADPNDQQTCINDLAASMNWRTLQRVAKDLLRSPVVH